MQQVYTDVIQYSGSHYDFGYMQGQLLKNSPIIPNRNKQWGHKGKYHFSIDVKKFKELILSFAPGIWEEIEGLADSLKWSMHDAIREFGGYYLEYGRSGCSIFTNSDFMVRNYDNHPASYEGRYILYHPTDQGYATLGPSMQITGRMDGLNDQGLTIGYNFVNRKKSADGFICNMIGRIILETCATVEEAIVLLKEIPHRHSFSYTILDQRGVPKVVEASPRRIEVHQSTICTNHFEKVIEENRYRMDESQSRQQVMLDYQDSIVSPIEAFEMMNNIDKRVFSTKYGAWAGTLHTSVYIPKEMKAWFALGGNRQPVIIDFKRWLQGEKLRVKRIKGELQADSRFVNMELF